MYRPKGYRGQPWSQYYSKTGKPKSGMWDKIVVYGLMGAEIEDIRASLSHYVGYFGEEAMKALSQEGQMAIHGLKKAPVVSFSGLGLYGVIGRILPNSGGSLQNDGIWAIGLDFNRISQYGEYSMQNDVALFLLHESLHIYDASYGGGLIYSEEQIWGFTRSAAHGFGIIYWRP